MTVFAHIFAHPALSWVPGPQVTCSVVVSSGRSAARLARLVRDQEVGGSNPLAPTEGGQAVWRTGGRKSRISAVTVRRSDRPASVAPVAQLDRASASGAEGRGFESRLAHRLTKSRTENRTKTG